jgi:hypothetical protein
LRFFGKEDGARMILASETELLLRINRAGIWREDFLASVFPITVDSLLVTSFRRVNNVLKQFFSAGSQGSWILSSVGELRMLMKRKSTK